MLGKLHFRLSAAGCARIGDLVHRRVERGRAHGSEGRQLTTTKTEKVNLRLWGDGLRRILHPSHTCRDDIRRGGCHRKCVRGVSGIASVTRVSDRRGNGRYADLPISRINRVVVIGSLFFFYWDRPARHVPNRKRLRRSICRRAWKFPPGHDHAHFYPRPDRLKIQVITLRGFAEANRRCNRRPHCHSVARRTGYG
jgi:hypothetical protein